MVENTHIPLIASLAGVVFCVMFCGCGGLILLVVSNAGTRSTQRTSIQYVLDEDQKLNQQLAVGSNPSEFANGVRVYVARANALDLSNCPAEFRLAYRRHLEAWELLGSAIDELPDNAVDAVFLGAANSLLRSEMDGGHSRLEGNFDRAKEQVRTTWFAVEDSAVKYGVAR